MMIFRGIILIVAVFTATAFADDIHVRHVIVKKDQIIIVKTSIGIATLIQIPDRPTSAIIGDTESFKVEYLENGVTIKPLHSNARTNLYLYTDNLRFNIHLVPVGKEVADYIVYLKNMTDPPRVERGIAWRQFSAHDSKNGLTLRVEKIGEQPGSGTLLVNFEVQTQTDLKVKPEWFWITQNKNYKPIQNLILSNFTASKSASIKGAITLQIKDLSESEKIHLELRAPKTLVVILPGVKRWLR